MARPKKSEEKPKVKKIVKAKKAVIKTATKPKTIKPAVAVKIAPKVKKVVAPKRKVPLKKKEIAVKVVVHKPIEKVIVTPAPVTIRPKESPKITVPLKEAPKPKVHPPKEEIKPAAEGVVGGHIDLPPHVQGADNLGIKDVLPSAGTRICERCSILIINNIVRIPGGHWPQFVGQAHREGIVTVEHIGEGTHGGPTCRSGGRYRRGVARFTHGS